MYYFIVCITLSLSVFAKEKKEAKSQPKEFITVLGTKTPYPYLKTDLNHYYSFEDLLEKNILHSEDLWSLIPNLNTSGGTNRTKYIQIRGIGERSQYENTPDASVGVFLDHIDLSGSANIIESNNLESVSLFKGPQSFFYGSDALAGNIVLKTKEPDSLEKQIDIKTSLSNYNTQSVYSRFSFPLNLSSSLSFAVNLLKSDGFIDNRFLNKPSSYREENNIYLNSLHSFKNFHIKTSHIFTSQRNGYDVWSFNPHTYETLSDKPGKDNQTTNGHSVEINTLLTSNITLSSISSISISDSFYSYDEDWGNNPYWNSIPGWNTDYNYNKSYRRENKKIHQKIILQQKKRRSLNYTGGVHYSLHTEDSIINAFKDSLLRKNINSDFQNHKFSTLFGISKDFRKYSFILNTRLEKQYLKYKTNSPFSIKDNEFLLGLNTEFKYRLNSRNKISFKFSKGFKSGGFNPDTNLLDSQQIYRSEDLYNYEINWDYQPLNLNLTLFYMDRRNQQITTSFQDDPMDPSSFSLYIDNAATSRNFGLEAQIQLLKSKNSSLKATLGLLKADFLKYEREGINFSNRDQAHSPGYTYSIESSYVFNSKLSLTALLYGKDSFFLSNGHGQTSKPYSLVDFYLDYKITTSSNIRLWSKNTLNKNYTTRGFYFANEPPLWIPKLYKQSGSPIQIGIGFSHQF